MDAIVGLRPFVPARDYRLSKSFYRALGFQPDFEGEDATVFRAGDFGFVLQNFHVQALADNFMVQLLVRALDHWWGALDTQRLVETYAVRPPRAPAMQPWGLRVGYLFDPSGVLWHVTEAPTRDDVVAHLPDTRAATERSAG